MGLVIRAKRYILLYKHSNYKGAALAGLVGKLVPGCFPNRLDNGMRVSSRGVLKVPVCCLTAGIKSIFRGPQARFFGMSISDRVTFKVRGVTIPPSRLRRQLRCALSSLGVHGLRNGGVFRLSNKRGRGVTFTSICTVGPSVFLLSRPSSGLSKSSVESLGGCLRVLGRRKGAVLVTRRELCCLLSVTSHVICLTSKGVRGVCAPRRFESLSNTAEGRVNLQAASVRSIRPVDCREAFSQPVLTIGSISLFCGGRPILRRVSLRTSGKSVVNIMNPGNTKGAAFLHALYKLRGRFANYFC